MKATFERYVLQFKRPSGTSRGVLNEKETFFIHLTDGVNKGIGECGILRTLSIDDRPDYVEKLKWTCDNIHLGLAVLYDKLREFPSIQFGLEQAFLDLKSTHHVLFPSNFTKGQEGIIINGLIWMGSIDSMKKQIDEKIEQGFSCVKMKIGAIHFEDEYQILKQLRNDYPNLELRVDANGAFHPNEALKKLEQLSKLNLHSIEQPIKPQQWEKMADLCKITPLPIALDEELIGVFDLKDKIDLLNFIKPQYIILKPSLVGGFKRSQEWINLAEEQNIGWWITSALESNVGLNAIAQWTYTLNNSMPQGLGTGGLYTNNIPSNLEIQGEKLFHK
ncbi:O-succinylbenzoate synthase [Flavobacteriaceae bacterium UJ101]|nr:O-succinylbenzoate synthase [Flavobacteriaceae bacterium UJ101]